MAANSRSSLQNFNNWGSGSGKTNAFLSQISQQRYISKIYFYAKNRNKAKYQLLINKREGSGLKQFNDCKSFIDYSNYMRF